MGMTQLNPSIAWEMWQKHKSTSQLKSPGAYLCVRLAWVLPGYFTVLLQVSIWWSTSVWEIFWEPELMKAKVPMFVLAQCLLYNKQSKLPCTSSANNTVQCIALLYLRRFGLKAWLEKAVRSCFVPQCHIQAPFKHILSIILFLIPNYN